jgi:thiamine kinase-like enzyme
MSELQAPADPAVLFDRVPCLTGTPRAITPLPGGLTNRNYKVTTPDGSFVARVWADGDLLAINRDHEHHNSVAAAAAGVGAPVLAYQPAEHVLVLGFLDGRTLGDADVAEPAMLPRIAAACRLLHAGPRFAGDFDMFQVQRRYLAVATEHGFGIPDGYAALAPQMQAAQQALAVRAEGTVPCNNDLLAANFIDDGERIWLIDYEYSGNNDPCFELGNIAAECRLPPDGLAELIRHYYGRPLRNKIARAELLGLAGKYGWTLWGAIQQASSPIEFDFWAWAMERFESAAAGLTSPRFAQLLDDVVRDD